MTTAQANHYSDPSASYLRKAYFHLAEGDLTQASEKGWGAAATAVKAVAESRGIPHTGHRELWRIVRTLVREAGDQDIRVDFGLAGELHVNFYEAWLDRDDVLAYLTNVERLAAKLDRLS